MTPSDAPTNTERWYAPLRLRPRELSVLNGAITSLFQFGIEDHLPNQGVGSQNAAKRLIERGYLTKGKAQLAPDPGWIVVRFTEANRQKMLTDLGVTEAANAE